MHGGHIIERAAGIKRNVESKFRRAGRRRFGRKRFNRPRWTRTGERPRPTATRHGPGRGGRRRCSRRRNRTQAQRRRRCGDGRVGDRRRKGCVRSGDEGFGRNRKERRSWNRLLRWLYGDDGDACGRKPWRACDSRRASELKDRINNNDQRLHAESDRENDEATFVLKH